MNVQKIYNPTYCIVDKWWHNTVFFNRGSAEPKGSASGIQGFCGTAGAQ